MGHLKQWLVLAKLRWWAFTFRLSLKRAGGGLKLARERAGVHSRRASLVVGVTEDTLLRWERGDLNPDPTKLAWLLNYYTGIVQAKRGAKTAKQNSKT